MKPYIFLLALCLPAMCSCNEDDGPDAPGSRPVDPIVKNEKLKVSFTGKFYRAPQGMPYDGKVSTVWSDTVWQNERVSNQLALWSETDDFKNLSVSVTPMSNGTGVIPAENIHLYSVGYVSGDPTPSIDAQPLPRPDAVMVADALLSKLPSALPVGSVEHLWLSVDVPAQCEPGVYTGTVNIADGDAVVQTCGIEFLVTAHTLPAPSDWNYHLDIWQFPFRLPAIINDNGGNVQPFSEAYYKLMTPFYSILADAGQKCITTYIKDGAFTPGETMVDWSRRADGSWAFDYTKFDSFVEFMTSLGIKEQISCFSVAGWNNSVGYTDLADNKYKTMQLPIGSTDFNSVWNAFLNDFRSHLTSKGWMDKAVLYMDENRNEDMREIVKTIRNNGSDWKIGYSGKYLDTDLERELFNYSSIISSTPTSTGNSVPVFYTSCSQMHPNNYLTPENSPAEMTWMAWHAMARGFKGYQRWAFDYWMRPTPFDARDRQNTAGDFHMIYRSSNGADAEPVLSIRWEMLRDGIQDYEKCFRLNANALTSTKALFADTEGLDAEAKVGAAQALVKKLSAQ